MHRTLPQKQQQTELQKLHEWAENAQQARTGYQSMTVHQLQELSRNPLFEIGAHTVSHAALAFHPPEIQEKEMRENRNLLRDITGRPIEMLSYPYGNYNAQTVQAAERSKFKAAFTTQEVPLNHKTQQLQMGRFQVKNLPPEAFMNQFLKR